MNKNLIIGGVVIAVVAVGGGFMLMNSKDKDQNNSTTTQQSNSTHNNTTSDTPTTETTNAEKLAQSGKPQQCTFDYDGDKGEATGQMYTDGAGKSRMTVVAIKTDQGNSGTNDMIIKDSKFYTWITTGGRTVGFSGELGSQSSSSSTSTTTPDKDFSMQCSNWTVDSSKFELPDGVSFTSFDLNNIPTAQ
jgi:uncharacterized protein YxeA